MTRVKNASPELYPALHKVCERVATKPRYLNRLATRCDAALMPTTMEFMMNIRTTLAALSLAMIGTAFAQTSPAPNTPRVDRREAKQEQRIEQGASSGALTAQESQRLNNGQARVANAEEKAKSDGTVTQKERARLTHMQNKQSRHIKRQKHDRQTTTPAG